MTLSRVGTEADFSTNTPGQAIKDGFLKAAWKKYFARPALIFFHTHRTFSESYLRTKGTNSVQDESGTLDARQLSEIYTLQTGNFSSSDLETVERNSRYVRSMMLGSAFGYRLIINPKFEIPSVDEYIGMPITPAEEYTNAYNSLSRIEWNKRMRNDPSCLDRVAYQQKVDELLKKFCGAKGYLLFGNDNYEDKVLKRM